METPPQLQVSCWVRVPHTHFHGGGSGYSAMVASRLLDCKPRWDFKVVGLSAFLLGGREANCVSLVALGFFQIQDGILSPGGLQFSWQDTCLMGFPSHPFELTPLLLAPSWQGAFSSRFGRSNWDLQCGEPKPRSPLLLYLLGFCGAW